METTENIGACGCCVQCCCDGGFPTGATEGCTNTVPAYPGISPENVSAVVDWDGFTFVIDEPYITPFHIYYSASGVTPVDFVCFTNYAQANNDESFNAFERGMIVNLELFGSSGGCLYMTGNINIYFTGTFPSNGFLVTAGTSTLSPAPSVCQTTVENQIDTTAPFWCPNNPYDSFITTELIIAP